MKTIIETIIAEFHERELPTVFPREAKLPEIPGKIDVVIGMRRTGKTFFLYQAMQRYLKQGLAKQRLLYINFDDERLLPLATDQLHLITDTYYQMFPHFKKEKCYFFFDEIQNINNWERYIRRLLDTENAHIFLTGSSAKLLSKEIATNLRGRSIATEIFPFSFRETLQYENPALMFKQHPGAQTRVLFANRLQQFLTTGGFPETQNIDPYYRALILQEYVDIVILRDIVERHQISNIQALRAMVRHLLNAPANLFSVNKFYNDLKSQSISCSKDTLYDYLNYLEDAYLVYPASVYTRSERVRRTNPRKIYAIDVGLINAFLHQPQSDWGRLLENFVYMELHRRHHSIEYYNTENNTEVDFITTSITGERALYQVAIDISQPETYQRELRALESAMRENKLKTAYLITLNQHETIKLKYGVIEVLPAWRWAVFYEEKI